MVTRRARKRRAGGNRSDLLIRDGEIIHLKCKDCFFGVVVEIPTGFEMSDGRTAIMDTVSLVECRYDSPQPADLERYSGERGSGERCSGERRSTEPARKFPKMSLTDWCGCFRPRNPKCRGKVHCTVDPRECGPDCENHVEHETGQTNADL
jgi:hypothetical protein